MQKICAFMQVSPYRPKRFPLGFPLLSQALFRLVYANYPLSHRIQVEALRPRYHPFLIMEIPRAYL